MTFIEEMTAISLTIEPAVFNQYMRDPSDPPAQSSENDSYDAQLLKACQGNGTQVCNES